MVKLLKDNLVSLIAKIGEKITIGKTKTLEKIKFKKFYLSTFSY